MKTGICRTVNRLLHHNCIDEKKILYLKCSGVNLFQQAPVKMCEKIQHYFYHLIAFIIYKHVTIYVSYFLRQLTFLRALVFLCLLNAFAGTILIADISFVPMSAI